MRSARAGRLLLPLVPLPVVVVVVVVVSDDDVPEPEVLLPVLPLVPEPEVPEPEVLPLVSEPLPDVPDVPEPEVPDVPDVPLPVMPLPLPVVPDVPEPVLPVPLVPLVPLVPDDVLPLVPEPEVVPLVSEPLLPVPDVPDVPLPVVPDVPLPVVPEVLESLLPVPVPLVPLVPDVLLPPVEPDVPPAEGAAGSVVAPPAPGDVVPAAPEPPLDPPVLPLPDPVPWATAQPPATVMQAAATTAKCLSFLLIQCSCFVEKVRSPGLVSAGGHGKRRDPIRQRLCPSRVGQHHVRVVAAAAPLPHRRCSAGPPGPRCRPRTRSTPTRQTGVRLGGVRPGRRVVGQDRGRALVRRGRTPGQCIQPAQHPAQVQRLGPQLDEAAVGEREVVLGRHRHRGRGLAARQLAQQRQQLAAVAVGQAHVQQQQHRIQARGNAQRLLAGAGHDEFQARTVFEQRGHQHRVHRMVLDVEHRSGGRGVAVHGETPDAQVRHQGKRRALAGGTVFAGRGVGRRSGGEGRSSMTREDHKSFGVSKPVGHVVISFPDAAQADAAAQALASLPLGADAVQRYSDQEMLGLADRDIANASPLAAMGQELNLLRARRELAARGYHWLVVHAPRDEQARQVADLAQQHGAYRAQSYGTFLIEELIDLGDQPQVGESPDRGLDAQMPSGREAEAAERHAADTPPPSPEPRRTR